MTSARRMLGTGRRRLQRLRARLPLAPAVSPGMPAPHRTGGPRLELGKALVACDLAPSYLSCWPLARRAWRDVVGVDPVLVLVADELPPSLAGDDSVRLFEPVPDVHTAFQAQTLRLLYPALLEGDSAVIVSDVDMIPLDADWYHRPLRHVSARDFVAYRDVLLPIEQIPICYNAAPPGTWAEVFDVRSLQDVRDAITRWGAAVEYAGERGGAGWDTDQQTLYRTLLAWAGRTRRVWLLDDRKSGFRRLERAELRKPGRLDSTQIGLLARGGYTDYHLLPQDPFAALNEEILERALG